MKYRQAIQKVEIIRNRLAKADPRIEHDIARLHSGRQSRIAPLFQPVKNVKHNIGVIRILMQLFRRPIAGTGRMHQDNRLAR